MNLLPDERRMWKSWRLFGRPGYPEASAGAHCVAGLAVEVYANAIKRSRNGW